VVKILRYRYCLGVADFVVSKLNMDSASGRVRIQITFLALAGVIAGASAVASSHASAGPVQASQSKALSKTDFEIIEGIFHDGLGTYAEVTLANELISLSRIKQPPFDVSRSKAKVLDAINRLPASHPGRVIFQREIANIESGVKIGAAELLKQAGSTHLTRVRHTALEYADVHAADLQLEFSDRADLPVSVKTDKSRKVAVAEGQTPHIEEKWAERYFRVSPDEVSRMIAALGFSSTSELKSSYLNVARLVAEVLIRRLGLVDCKPTDFSRARVTDLAALKFLLHQLVLFKSGKDRSRVIIFDRSTGEVKWESLLDEIDIEGLTAGRVSMLPSRPRSGHPIGSEFGIKIDGRTIVSFQIKHKRGRARATTHRLEFSDITTRLRIE
jgi:hypothetical protein